MRSLILALTVIATASPALAADPLKMLCENPRREYLVTFDPDARSFVVDGEEGETRYSVASVEVMPGNLIVFGTATGDDAPDFAAWFGLSSRVDYLVDDAIVQSDDCRSVAERFRT